MALVNTQSGRAAVQVPAPSLMLDDGEVERRVRLIRPMERPSMPLGSMPETHWREADRDAFAKAWADEVAQVPEFTTSEIHIVTGLLLPIWNRFPNDFHARLSLADRCRRAPRRPQGIAGVGRCDTRRRAGQPLARRRFRGADRWPDGYRAHGRTSTAPRPRHGRAPDRAHRLQRTDARAPASLWPLQRDHRLEVALLRARHVRAAPAEAGGEACSDTGEAILARLIERYPLVRVCARAAD